MKKSKVLLSVFFLLIALVNNGQTGNPDWTLPPNYTPTNPPNAGNALPTQSAPGYTGWTSISDKQLDNQQGPHNIYMDAGGNPLFFINSGVVFSPRGYLVDTLIDTITVNRGGSNFVARQIACGWSESCVVPMPGSCSKYYIFSAVDYGSSANSTFKSCYQNGSPHYEVSFKPCYAIIDVSQANPNAPGGSGELGKIVVPSGSPVHGRKVVDLYSSTSTGSSEVGNSCSPYAADIHFACTKLLNGSFRYLFVKTLDELIVYKIDGTSGTNGITFVQNNDLSFWDTDLDAYNNKVLSELEVYDDSVNSKIKVACTMASGSNGHKLIFANFNRSTGNLITSPAPNIKCFSSCANYLDVITGVEFSPDGNTVFITRARTTQDTATVQAINYATPSTVTKLSYKADFAASQMELAKDGNIYLIGQTGAGTPRFAKITSPNSSPGFTDNVATLSSYATTSPQRYTYPPGTGYQDMFVFYLPDQIDKEYYGTPQFGDANCCALYSVYDANFYTTVGTNGRPGGYNQVWKPGTGNNPFNTSSTVYIGKELRITEGYTVSIQNMTIKFTPQATFIVEGYSGGASASAKLVLRKCTLDVDNRCVTKMWPGIRVWGNKGITRSNTTQGYIDIDSSCVITNAWIGVEAGYDQTNEWKYNTGIVPIPKVAGSSDTVNVGGGIIEIKSSSFINNQRDIYLVDYTFGTNGNTHIYNSNFTTNATLIGSAAPICHIQIDNYKPQAQVYGDIFSCSTSVTGTGYVYSQNGITSLNSSLAVDWFAATSARSKFSNFAYGVYATATGGNTNGVFVNHSTFTNNEVGTYMKNLVNPGFSNDSVKIRNHSGACLGAGCSTNKSGLFLDNTTGYKVNGNYFTQNASGTRNPFGIVVNNSGSYVNCIYNNQFVSLYKGSQAQYRNYISTFTSGLNRNEGGGLIFLCNTFTSPITNGDIYVPGLGQSANVGTAYSDTAGICYSQGTGGLYPKTSANQFSHSTGTSAYDVYIDTTSAKAWISNFFYCSTCGSSYDPIKRHNTGKSAISSNENCATDPYSQGLRIANSKKGSASVFEKMLNDAANCKERYDSLNNIMENLSADDTSRAAIGRNMCDVFNARHRLIDEAIHLLVGDTLQNDSIEGIVHSLMKEKALELPSRSKLETAIAIQDSAMGAQALSEVLVVEGQSNYVKLHTILLANLGKTPREILSNPSVLSDVQAMENDSTDRTAYIKVSALLEAVGLSDYQPYYQEGQEQDSGSVERKMITTDNLLANNSLLSKPNPFKESTLIKATVSTKTENAYVVVTDMLGKEVGKYKLIQGENEINFVATDKEQQVFFCSLIIDGVKIKTNKMVLIK